MKLKITIQRTIILFNAILLTLLGGAIIAIYSSRTEASIYALANNLMQEITRTAVNKTVAYLNPAERAVQDMGLHFYHPDFQTFRDNLPLKMDYLKSILMANPEFRAVYFGDRSGNLVMQRRMPDGTLTARYIDRKDDGVYVKWVHDNPTYYADFPDEVFTLEKGYDPRVRSWYTSAVEKKSVTWTPVYVFATDKMPGLSCVIPVYQRTGELTGVASVDIGILDLSFFLKNLATTKNGLSFFLDSQKRILGLPMQPQDPLEILFKKNGAESQLRTLSEITEPLYAEAYHHYLENNSPQGAFSFDYQGARYFASFSSVNRDRNLDLTFGLIIPDKDLTGAVQTNNLIAIGISILMLIVAVFLSIFLSRAISNPIRVLGQEMRKVKDFSLDSEETLRTRLKEIDHMHSSFNLMKQGLRNFRKYVPADLVKELIKLDKEATLGGERRELTIFFSDIADFTKFSETTTPENLVADLCEYFAIISKYILDSQGTLDKYIGDSVMAFWGAPHPLQDHAKRACSTALEIKKALHTLFLTWENQGKVRLHTRMGIHTGEVIVGNMGYEDRINYTAIGDSVNLASRMEGLNKYYGTEILITESVYEQVKDHFEFRRLDLVAVKGKNHGIGIYELLAFKDQVAPAEKKLYQLYEDGWNFYRQKDWQQAAARFNHILKTNPKDGPSRTLLDRCKTFNAAPPPGDWDGIYRFDEK